MAYTSPVQHRAIPIPGVSSSENYDTPSGQASTSHLTELLHTTVESSSTSLNLSRERALKPAANELSFRFPWENAQAADQTSLNSEMAANPALVVSADEISYETALENLKSHLDNLGNPYLVTTICDKLNTFLAKPIDISSKKALMEDFQDSLPHETKQYFETLFSLVISSVKENLSSINKITDEIIEKLEKLTDELRTQNVKNLNNYKGWASYTLLFSAPDFLRLRDPDFKKLIKVIDYANPDLLIECVDQLHATKALNKQSIKAYLKQVHYKYNLNNLLNEVIDTKPKKNEGIFTYWNYSKEFFVHKTLQLRDPNGGLHTKCVVRCEVQGTSNERTSIQFYFQDKSDLLIQRTSWYNSFQVFLRKQHYYPFWFALLSGNIISKGERFSIEYPSESTSITPFSLKCGEYLFVVPPEKKNSYVFTNYFEVELLDADSKERRYLLQGVLKTRAADAPIDKVKVRRWDPERKAYESESIEGIHAFNSAHRLVKIEMQPLTGINLENAEECIIIKDEPNEERIRLLHLEEIKKELNALLDQLKSTKDLLEPLIESLVTNKLTNIPFRQLSELSPSLAHKIKNLSERYFKDLKIERSPEDILIQIVLEANYSSLVQMQDNILTARTMELLRAARKHAREIANQKLVLFIGNTGSGKSTSIGFLMGAPLKKCSNPVGENVLKIKEGSPINAYPKIGQSIGTSETIYTQGYKVPNADFILGDCPGFNDTRGGDFELCTNFSIDQAVDYAESILAIVLVIPASAFLIDRGNNIIELIKTVQNRFYGTFDPEHLENSRRVYLLITKSASVQPEVGKSLREGTFFLEILKDIEDQLKDLETRCGLDSLECNAMRERQDIWRAIYQLLGRKQIHFINTKYLAMRKQLLELYGKSNTFDKCSYQPAMANVHMQQKFGNCVQMSAHTWSHHILRQYLQAVPKDIEAAIKVLKRMQDDLGEWKFENEQQEKLLEILNEQERALDKHVKHLRANRGKLTDESLRNVLAVAIQNSNDNLKSKKLALKENEAKLKTKCVKLKEVEDEILDLECQIKDKKVKSAELEEKLCSLEDKDNKDPHIDPLWEYRPKLGTYRWHNWKSQDAIQEAERELEKKDSHFQDSFEVNHAEYRGLSTDVAIIKKGYTLVPSDPEQRKAFFAVGKASGFEAKVEGLRYKIYPGRAQPDGKKIGYKYTLEWLGNEDLPWITITHTIPKREYHYATIVGLKSEFALLEKELIDLHKQLYGGNAFSGAKQREEELKGEINVLSQEIGQHSRQIKELEEAKVLERLEDLLQRTEHELAATRAKNDKVDRMITYINNKIQSLPHEIERQERTIFELEKRLRNLAIIIYTQWENAVRLREFSQLIIGEKDQELKHRDDTISRCREFIEIFDKNSGSLVAQIKEKYDF